MADAVRHTPEAADLRSVVAEFIGAVLHGAIYVGRTPDGFDGATKDDVIEFAGRLAELLNDGAVGVEAPGLTHGARLKEGPDPECEVCDGTGAAYDDEDGGSLDCACFGAAYVVEREP